MKTESIRQVVIISLVSYALLLLVTGLLPVAFAACSKDSVSCDVAYWLTQSAGKYGTLLIVVVAGVLYTVRLTTRPEKARAFLKSVAFLLILLSVFAFVNEHVTKKILRLPRPSQLYVLDRCSNKVSTDSLCAMPTDSRQRYIKEQISRSSYLTENIDGKVLDHWVDESGYSFPSGHSFNAFLLATILSFSLTHTRWRKLFFLPFAWAVSVALARVAIGAHSAADVSVGGAMGIGLALIFLYFDRVKKLVIRKRSADS